MFSFPGSQSSQDSRSLHWIQKPERKESGLGKELLRETGDDRYSAASYVTTRGPWYRSTALPKVKATLRGQSKGHSPAVNYWYGFQNSPRLGPAIQRPLCLWWPYFTNQKKRNDLQVAATSRDKRLAYLWSGLSSKCCVGRSPSLFAHLLPVLVVGLWLLHSQWRWAVRNHMESPGFQVPQSLMPSLHFLLIRPGNPILLGHLFFNWTMSAITIFYLNIKDLKISI